MPSDPTFLPREKPRRFPLRYAIEQLPNLQPVNRMYQPGAAQGIFFNSILLSSSAAAIVLSSSSIPYCNTTSTYPRSDAEPLISAWDHYHCEPGRCCANRDWPARCQPTGSSPACHPLLKCSGARFTTTQSSLTNSRVPSARRALVTRRCRMNRNPYDATKRLSCHNGFACPPEVGAHSSIRRRRRSKRSLARIGRLCRVAHRMGERGLDHFAWCVCPLSRPIPKARPEPMRHGGDAEFFDQFRQRHVQRAACRVDCGTPSPYRHCVSVRRTESRAPRPESGTR